MKFKFVVFFLLCSMISEATHIRGGYIKAERISDRTYEFTVVGYRDSNPGIKIGGGTFAFGDGETRDGAVDGFTITETKVADNIYRQEFKLRHTYSSPRSFVASYQEDFRNANIANADNTVNTSFYVETIIVIDPIVSTNTTPNLTIDPLVFTNAEFPFYQNLSITDAEGDYLRYRLVAPRQSENETVFNYRYPDDERFYEDYSNYAGTGNPRFEINKFTGSYFFDRPGDRFNLSRGDCQGSSQNCAEYLIAFVVEEYSRQNPAFLLSITRFDLTITFNQDIGLPATILSEPSCLSLADTLSATFFNYDTFKIDHSTFEGVKFINGQDPSLFKDSIFTDSVTFDFIYQDNTNISSHTLKLTDHSDSSVLFNYVFTIADNCEHVFENDSIGRYVVSQKNELSSLKIFPNPAADYLNIELRETFQGTYRFSMIGLDGKSVIDPLVLHKNEEIALPPDIKNGLYIVQITDMLTKEHVTKKIYVSK